MRKNYYHKCSPKQSESRYRLYLFALLLLFISGIADAQSLYMKKYDGSLSVYTLDNIRSLVFSDGDVIMNDKDNSISMMQASTIRYVSFREIATRLAKTKVQGGIFSLFPNPVNDKLNVVTPEEIQKLVTIEILSLEGKILYKEKLPPQKQIHQANVSALSPNLYLCKIQMGAKIEILKFWKY